VKRSRTVLACVLALGMAAAVPSAASASATASPSTPANITATCHPVPLGRVRVQLEDGRLYIDGKDAGRATATTTPDAVEAQRAQSSRALKAGSVRVVKAGTLPAGVVLVATAGTVGVAKAGALPPLPAGALAAGVTRAFRVSGGPVVALPAGNGGPPLACIVPPPATDPERGTGVHGQLTPWVTTQSARPEEHRPTN
jgi:hypothetical protein